MIVIIVFSKKNIFSFKTIYISNIDINYTH